MVSAGEKNMRLPSHWQQQYWGGCWDSRSQVSLILAAILLSVIPSSSLQVPWDVPSRGPETGERVGTIPCTWKSSKVEVNSSPVKIEAIDNERFILNNNMVGEGSENEKTLIFYKTCEIRHSCHFVRQWHLINHSPSQQRIQFFSLYSSMIEDLFSSGKQIFIRYDFISLPSLSWRCKHLFHRVSLSRFSFHSRINLFPNRCAPPSLSPITGISRLGWWAVRGNLQSPPTDSTPWPIGLLSSHFAPPDR